MCISTGAADEFGILVEQYQRESDISHFEWIQLQRLAGFDVWYSKYRIVLVK